MKFPVLRIFQLICLTWWIWLGASIFREGSTAVVLQIYERGYAAVDASWVAGARLGAAGISMFQAVYLWSVVFAPFVNDLVKIGFPFFQNAVSFLAPKIQIFANWVFLELGKLPLEISISLVWIPLCLLASNFSRKFLHGLILPLVWSSVRILPVGSRLPLIFSALVFPGFLSLWRFRKNSKEILPLISYWAIFPILVWADKLLFPMLGIFQGVYASTLSALIPWAIFTGETCSFVDFAERADWGGLGRRIWRSLSFFGGGEQMVTAVRLISKLREISSIYQIGLIGFFVLTLAYWAFSLILKLVSVLVWPWFFFEVGRVCLSRSVFLYRQILAFSLVFLTFEFFATPNAPMGFSAILTFFHLPLVFGFKVFAEPLLDLFLKCIPET